MNGGSRTEQERRMIMEHITHEKLQAYVRGTLSVEEESEIMTHIAKCDQCAEWFADLLMAENPVSSPPDLKENILDKTVYRKDSAGVIRKILAARQERQREFLVYCARVVFAMAASVLMVLSVSSGKFGGQRMMPAETMQIQEESEHGRRDIISSSLQKASGRVGDALNDFLTLFDRSEEEERK